MNKFDIFISFKNSTSDGSQTRDAQIAEQIYREFCLMGISAFYSNITLLKLGESVYKRSIDHALDTAKILLLISTDPSYIESRWIKYEWESFHTDILNDIKKDAEIITYTDGISPHALPRALRSYQNCDIQRMDISAFCAFTKKVLEKLSSPANQPEQPDLRAGKTPSDTKTRKSHKSIYSSPYRNEADRLRIQAGNSASSDRIALEYLKSQGALREHSVILDAGCAYGYVAEDRFGNAGWTDLILGIDNNPLVIEKARQLHDNPKMAFEVIDLEDENFTQLLKDMMERYGIRKFDIIFSALTLHHLKNPGKVLHRLRRFLADDGYVILRGSDDGSKLCYPGSDLMDQIIEKSLTAHGVSDRLNGRKLYTQLFDTGYHDIHIFSNIKDLSNMDYDDRDDLFHESFSYRSDYFRKAYEKDPYNIQCKNDFEWMQEALDLFEQQFYERNFWYCEYDYIAVARK